MPPKAKKPKPTPKRLGRPPKPDQRYTPVLVRIPPEMAVYFTALGDGTLAAGVRKAVDREYARRQQAE